MIKLSLISKKFRHKKVIYLVKIFSDILKSNSKNNKYLMQIDFLNKIFILKIDPKLMDCIIIKISYILNKVGNKT